MARRSVGLRPCSRCLLAPNDGQIPVPRTVGDDGFQPGTWFCEGARSAWPTAICKARFGRGESVTYPAGRVVEYDYGPAGGVNDRLSRVERIVDVAQPPAAGSVLATYSYLGDGTIVRVSKESGNSAFIHFMVSASGGNSNENAMY